MWSGWEDAEHSSKLREKQGVTCGQQREPEDYLQHHPDPQTHTQTQTQKIKLYITVGDKFEPS